MLVGAKSEEKLSRDETKSGGDKPVELKKTAFDLNRDSAIRYFGYASEVRKCTNGFMCGLSSLLLIPAWTTFTFSYIIRDAYSKSKNAYMYTPPKDTLFSSRLRAFFEWIGLLRKRQGTTAPTECKLRRKACIACGDALIWQGLASLLIPAFIVQNTQYYGSRAMCRIGAGSRVAYAVPTLAALALLPILSKPVDKAVDQLMDSTYRSVFSEN